MKFLKCKKCGHINFINRICVALNKGKILTIQRGDNLYCEKCRARYDIYKLDELLRRK